MPLMTRGDLHRVPGQRSWLPYVLYHLLNTSIWTRATMPGADNKSASSRPEQEVEERVVRKANDEEEKLIGGKAGGY